MVAGGHRRTSTETRNGVRVIRVGTLCTLSRAPICPGMARQISLQEADIVHLHLPNPGAVLSYLASGHRGRLVLTEHAEVFGRPVLKRAFVPFLRSALNRAAAVIATSRACLNQSSVLAACAGKCRVIPLGIEPPRRQAGSSAGMAALRSRYGSPLILAVGRLVPYKGFVYLIAAMRNLSASLVIVGDGPEMAHLREAARDCGVAGSVHFAGSVPGEDIADYFRAAEIFVLPSIESRESFGIVQLEAMAYGKPVINTSLNSGVPYVSLDGVTGFTVAPRDSEALAAKIQRLLDNPLLRARFGEAGRRRVEEEFSADRMAQRTLDLYREILQNGRAKTVPPAYAAFRSQAQPAEGGERPAVPVGAWGSSERGEDVVSAKHF